jgi:hypothetical protein
MLTLGPLDLNVPDRHIAMTDDVRTRHGAEWLDHEHSVL